MHLGQVRMSMQILDEIFLQCIFCAFLVEFAEVTQQLLDFSLRTKSDGKALQVRISSLEELVYLLVIRKVVFVDEFDVQLTEVRKQ